MSLPDSEYISNKLRALKQDVNNLRGADPASFGPATDARFPPPGLRANNENTNNPSRPVAKATLHAKESIGTSANGVEVMSLDEYNQRNQRVENLAKATIISTNTVETRQAPAASIFEQIYKRVEDGKANRPFQLPTDMPQEKRSLPLPTAPSDAGRF